MIVMTDYEKRMLDYAMSTTLSSKEYEEVLINFIRKYINKDFQVTDCKCKSKLTKAKRIIKQVYKDIKVIEKDEEICPVCDTVFKPKSSKHIYCSKECRNKK